MLSIQLFTLVHVIQLIIVIFIQWLIIIVFCSIILSDNSRSASLNVYREKGGP